MVETAPLATHAWESFYVIVGSSAGALIGLQFVVLTLITEAGIIRGTDETVSAFSSPNVVHFCAALLVSAIFCAPWRSLGPPGVAAALAGVCGFVYSVVVLRRTLRQRDYKPVLEDWIWHAALPMLAYATLVHAGFRLTQNVDHALYTVAGSALPLVFVGIHNAWDTVMYVTLERARERKTKAAAASERPSAAGNASAAGKDVGPSAPPPARNP
jgi:hypothetical protein